MMACTPPDIGEVVYCKEYPLLSGLREGACTLNRTRTLLRVVAAEAVVVLHGAHGATTVLGRMLTPGPPVTEVPGSVETVTQGPLEQSALLTAVAAPGADRSDTVATDTTTDMHGSEMGLVNPSGPCCDESMIRYGLMT